MIRPKTFTHFGRNISFEKACGQVLNTTFSEICDRALGASDYIQLTQYFHTIIIRDVPQLNLKLKSQTRRFITLIDSLYDHRIRVRKFQNKIRHEILKNVVSGCDLVGSSTQLSFLERTAGGDVHKRRASITHGRLGAFKRFRKINDTIFFCLLTAKLAAVNMKTFSLS